MPRGREMQVQVVICLVATARVTDGLRPFADGVTSKRLMMFEWRQFGQSLAGQSLAERPTVAGSRLWLFITVNAVIGVMLALVLFGDIDDWLSRARAGSDVTDTGALQPVARARTARAERSLATHHLTRRPVAPRLINAGSVSERSEGVQGIETGSNSALHAGSTGDTTTVAAITDDDDLEPAGSMADWYASDRVTYRTVCVRLCDGAMVPVSYATTPDRFKRDAERCGASCGSPSKLFVQRNPLGDVEDLVALDGTMYVALPNAFRFRVAHDNACSCRPNAWESAAQARHRRLAITARLTTSREKLHAPVARLAGLVARVQVAAAADGEPSVPAALAKSTVPQKKKSAAKSKRGGRVPGSQVAGVPQVAILFGPNWIGSAPPANTAYAPKRQADLTSRRFDGTDWRINVYEPL